MSIELKNEQFDAIERGFQGIIEDQALVGKNAVDELFIVIQQATGRVVNLDYDGDESDRLVEFVGLVIEEFRKVERQEPWATSFLFRVGDGEELLRVGVCGDVFFGRPDIKVAENASEAMNKWKRTTPRVPVYGVNN